MSFHIKDDFKAGAPVSQVPASWFNTVAKFLNGLVGGFGIKTNKKESERSTIALDEAVLRAEIDNVVDGLCLSRDQGDSPTDGTDTPIAVDAAGGTWEWTSGGLNGLDLDCYCLIAPQASGSNYSVFQRARLSFSKDGLLVHGELLPDRIRIQAKNA